MKTATVRDLRNRFARVSGTSYTHRGLRPSTTHYYRVVAANTGGESIPTAQVSATTSASAQAQC